jgi:mitotic spindle assembly checkpoint protein MAD2
MASTKQKSRQAITLKGSTNLVTEFFKYAVNTYEFWLSVALIYTHCLSHRILFQREVYPSDDFQMVKKYGQTVLVTQDLALENYLDRYVALFVLISRIEE